MFRATRTQVLEAARQLLGVRFRHQGRAPATGVDCVGLLVVVGRALGYPNIVDVEGYRRTPSADTIRRTLEINCDEIAPEDARDGDIWLMRLGGVKPRHVGFVNGSQILHASAKGVRSEDKSNFPPSWFVAAFRLRGVVD